MHWEQPFFNLCTLSSITSWTSEKKNEKSYMRESTMKSRWEINNYVYIEIVSFVHFFASLIYLVRISRIVPKLSPLHGILLFKHPYNWYSNRDGFVDHREWFCKMACEYKIISFLTCANEKLFLIDYLEIGRKHLTRCVCWKGRTCRWLRRLK